MNTLILNYSGKTVKTIYGEVYPNLGIARQNIVYTGFNENHIAFFSSEQIVNLPEPEPGVLYIVPYEIKCKSTRTDLLSPAYTHSDCIISPNGDIKVPGFIY